MNPRNTVISHFVCPVCGMDIPLPRKRDKQRSKGHKKAIYCPRCGKKQNCDEFSYQTSYRNMAGDIL